MGSTAGENTQTELSRPDTPDDDSTVHWSCSRHPDIALCGLDLTGHEDLGTSAEVDCQRCIDLYIGVRCSCELLDVIRPRR